MPEQRFKIVFFADSHLGFDYPLRPKLQIRRRGPDFFANFHRILRYAMKTRPDMLIHGGDLFFRSRVAPLIVDKVYKALFDFVNNTNIPILIVPGNHERSRLPQSLYLAHPLIHIFDRPRCYIFNKNDSRAFLYGFPFYRGNVRDDFKDLVSQCGWQKNTAKLQLLILHQAVDGAQVGPADYTFRNSKDVINIKDIPSGVTAVLCGHIHRRQVLYSGNVPLIYPGSIERTSFAEKDEQKGFYEIDFAPGTNNNVPWRVDKLKFLRLPARPMFDIHLPRTHSKSEIKQSVLKQSAELPAQSIVRLRLQPKKTEDFPAISIHLIRNILPASFSIQTGLQYQNNRRRTINH